MQKILVVLGGGRPKGNTRQLVDSFIQGATDAGNDVELISLNKTEVKGCNRMHLLHHCYFGQSLPN